MPKFLIIGAGVAGPIVALRLAQDGHECTIFERAAKPHTIGGAVNIAPNGMRLFDRLGLRAEIEQRGCIVESFEIKEEKDGVLGHFWMKSKDGFVSVRIMRSTLQAILLEECGRKGVKVLLEKALESVEDGDGKVTGRFADGARVVGDFLIGADGIHSKTRQYVVGKEVKAVQTGSSIVYGILPTKDLPGVDFTTLHPTFGIMARTGFFAGTFTDNERSQVYWISQVAKPAEKVDTTELREQEQERYKHLFEPVPEIIGATKNFFAWDIYELPPLPRWSKNRIVLIGDAAHAMPPNQGQGVSQAIEDVFVLARVISKGADLSRYYEIRSKQVEKLRESFHMKEKENERGPWAQWFTVWGFWAILWAANIWSVVGWDRFGYDVDTIKI